MILEIANITVTAGKQKDFEGALEKAQAVLKQSAGYVSHEFKKCVETNTQYVLLITWETLEAHTVGFRESELFTQWRSLIGPFFAVPPEVFHYSSL